MKTLYLAEDVVLFLRLDLVVREDLLVQPQQDVVDDLAQVLFHVLAQHFILLQLTANDLVKVTVTLLQTRPLQIVLTQDFTQNLRKLQHLLDETITYYLIMLTRL